MIGSRIIAQNRTVYSRKKMILAKTGTVYLSGRISFAPFEQGIPEKNFRKALIVRRLFLFTEKSFNGYNKHDIQLSCWACYDRYGV